MHEEKWIPISIGFDSPIFSIFSKVIKQVTLDKDTVTISIVNKERSSKIKTEVKDLYRFNFQWQDENICGIDVFKKGE